MNYSFDIVGVSPFLYFFSHQQQSQQKPQTPGLEYVASHKCTLDALIESVEPVPAKWDWDMDKVVDTVIHFWMNNSESISYWKSRLNDAGRDNLLVVRVADIKALQADFDSLLGRQW
jgi:hypothetical protein